MDTTDIGTMIDTFNVSTRYERWRIRGIDVPRNELDVCSIISEMAQDPLNMRLHHFGFKECFLLGSLNEPRISYENKGLKLKPDLYYPDAPLCVSYVYKLHPLTVREGRQTRVGLWFDISLYGDTCSITVQYGRDHTPHIILNKAKRDWATIQRGIMDGKSSAKEAVKARFDINI